MTGVGYVTYFVSSCIRLASTGVSPSVTWGLVLAGRLGGGDSGGLGWVSVKGSSTAKSLKHNDAHNIAAQSVKISTQQARDVEPMLV